MTGHLHDRRGQGKGLGGWDSPTQDVGVEVVQPAFRKGAGKRIAQVTMEHIREAVVANGLGHNGCFHADALSDHGPAGTRHSRPYLLLQKAVSPRLRGIVAQHGIGVGLEFFVAVAIDVKGDLSDEPRSPKRREMA